MVSEGACASEHIQLCKGSLTITKPITIWLNITISTRLIWWQLKRYSLSRCHRQCRSYSITGLIAKTHPLGSLESQAYVGTPKLMICLNKNKVLVIHCFWAAHRDHAKEPQCGDQQGLGFPSWSWHVPQNHSQNSLQLSLTWADGLIKWGSDWTWGSERHI